MSYISDYTIHKDPERRLRYVNHKRKPREEWYKDSGVLGNESPLEQPIS